MALPTAAKADLRRDGYTVLKGIIPPEIIDNALSAIDKMFAATGDANIFEAEKRKFPMRTMADPYFEHGLTHDKDVMALFYCSPVYSLVESLLHNEIPGPEYIAEGRFKPRALGAKVAYRVPEPMPVSDGCCIPSSATSSRPLGGAAWHIDAMDIGQLCPFSVLIGVALSDQMQDACGNLAVHPGSHYSLMPFMKKFAETRGLDIADPQVAQARRQKAIALLQNKPVLDEPVQVKLAKGDVVIALFKLAHLGTPNYSENTRKMVYFRVSHRELEKLRIPALEDLWIEYEGINDVVK
jgi:hypothetical protein